jgi:hypothetical protein
MHPDVASLGDRNNIQISQAGCHSTIAITYLFLVSEWRVDVHDVARQARARRNGSKGTQKGERNRKIAKDEEALEIDH